MVITSFFFFFLFLLVFLFSLISLLVSIKMKYDREKLSVFECGFDLMSALRLPFSLNFYFIIIIFLIFDVELVLILPFIFSMKILMTYSTMMLLFVFFVILIVGFIYEWMSGMLNWLI